MFSVSKPLFWLFMALILCFMLVMHWFSVRDGIPQIKAAVLREAASLSRSEDSLRSLDLGRITRTRYEVRDSDSAITGYFQFDGSYSNQSWDVFVYWRKADSNAPIDKIEIGSTYQELRTIWSRK
jgi:hypothetical protein